MQANQELIDNFDILKKYYQQKDDRFRYRAYARAVNTIRRFPKITNISQVKNTKGIGKTITAKIREFLETGKINKVEIIKDEITEIHPFEKIFGIGPVTSKKLQKKGFNTISQLRQNKNILTKQQQIGLKYYYELLEKIPRIKISALEYIIRLILNREFGKNTYKMDIAGSYRRGKMFSGDIDLLITSKIFNIYDVVNVLKEYDLITDTLSMKNTKFMGIAKCPGKEKPHYRLDIEFLPENEYATGLLYFTGSKEFNIEMRAHAKKMGYILNEHGLFTNSKKIEINYEKDVFDILNLEYSAPNKR